jgi:integrase
MSPEELRDKIFRAKDVMQDYGYAAETGDYSKVEGLVDHILEHTGGNPPTKGSDEYKLICQKAAEAMKDKWGKYEQYHTERLSRTINAINGTAAISLAQPTINTPSTSLPKGQSTSTDVVRDPGKKISEVILPFIDEKKESGLPKKYTQDLERSLNLFMEVAGDAPIQTVKRAKVAEYKALLRKLPPRFNIMPDYRDKPVAELVEMSHKETLSPGRINKYLDRVGQLFKYAIIEGIYEGPNPATELQVPENRRESEKRAAYTNDELVMLFRSKEYLEDSFKFHYQFWTSIIALFHGMRQNEIAGLFVEDVKEDDGLSYFDLYSRKSNPRCAWRKVPIHPFLIEELNFLAYLQKIKNEGNQQLFPECTKTRDGYGKKVSRWFNGESKEDGGYKKRCGITSPDGRMRDFHSFRETFITRLRHKKVHDRELKAVVGHSTDRDVTDGYTEPYPVKQLYDNIILEVEFHNELDLSHLKKSKYVPK